jgi:hypothetical protein
MSEEISNANALTCKGDVYGGITIRSGISLNIDFNSKIPTTEEARQKLKTSLDHWKASKINGVWFEVMIEVSFTYLPIPYIRYSILSGCQY